MRFSIIILFLALLGSFHSCKQEDESSPLLGKWLEQVDENSTDTIADVLIFAESESGTSFSQSGWYENQVDGSWKHSGDSLLLTYVVPQSHDIDSIVLTHSADGTHTTEYYENNRLFVQYSKNMVESSEQTDHSLICLTEKEFL